MRTVCWTLLLGLTSFPYHASAMGRDDPRVNENPKRRAKPHVKGIELYSTYHAESKEWRFGWLPGTNRIKTADEVNASLKIVGLKALKRELETFAEHEGVFVVENDWPGKPKGINVTLPSRMILMDLQAFCKSRKIKFDW